MNDVLSRSQSSKDLEAYWRRLSNVFETPDHESFDLTDIPELVPELFVLNLMEVPERKAHIKSSGSNLNVRAGFELTGENFLDLWHKDVRDVVWNVFRKSVERPCGFVLLTRVRLRNASSAVMEATVVPFQKSDQSPPSVLMSCVWTGVALTLAMQKLIVIEIPDRFSWIDLGHGVPGRSPLDF